MDGVVSFVVAVFWLCILVVLAQWVWSALVGWLGLPGIIRVSSLTVSVVFGFAIGLVFGLRPTKQPPYGAMSTGDIFKLIVAATICAGLFALWVFSYEGCLDCIFWPWFAWEFRPSLLGFASGFAIGTILGIWRERRDSKN